MNEPPSGLNERFTRAQSELAGLRQFPGAPKDFWPRFLSCAAGLAGADRIILLLRDPADPARWKKLGEWSANRGATRAHQALAAQAEALAIRAAESGTLVEPLEPGSAAAPGQHAFAVRLNVNDANQLAVLVGLAADRTAAAAQESLQRLSLAADTPEIYQQNLAARQARADVEKFAAVLDLLVPVNAEKRFLGAAMALANAIATRFACDRASLGWLEGGYIRLRAISRTEKFDRRMAAAQALETAMEECLDQDEEILWPAPEGSTVIGRDHEKFVQSQQAGNLCSLPLRRDGKPMAVLLCERLSAPFSELEVQQLRLACDQMAGRLADLRRTDRWFGARWATSVRENAATLLGPQHTWAKLLALTGTLALAVLFFIPFRYRVEGTFFLRSDEVSFLTAPFDGYIESVLVRPGDQIDAGGTLISLNTAELLLEEAGALADLNRFLRETEKARASKALADMRIGEAQAEQARARLDLVRHHLQAARIKAPFAGVVVEGDLRERIAAPVRQGDPLFKIARLDRLYAEAEIHERDIHELLKDAPGEIAFVSQPKLKYPIHLARVEPAAVPKKDENMFVTRLTFDSAPADWWRPGMSGLCKIEAGHRTLFWILTHRTVDFLRMKLWW